MSGYLGEYFHGTLTTLSLAGWAGAGASLLGVVLASWRVSPLVPLRFTAQVYVDVIRNIPVILLLVMGYFALPGIGISYSAFTTSVAVLAVSGAADIAEVLVAGFNSVSLGEIDAAISLGMRYGTALRTVILPQAARTVAYPLGAALITLTKNTSIASAIAVSELTAVAQGVGAATNQPIPAFVGAASAYIIVITPVAIVLRRGAAKVQFRR